jgi:hypothetical protein
MFLRVGRETDLGFAPLERGEAFGGRAFYKHLAPLGRSNNDARCTSTLSPPILICERPQFTRQRATDNEQLTTDNRQLTTD